MVDINRANRRFERMLFLTPHEPIEDDDDKLIAKITYDFKNQEVRVRRFDDPIQCGNCGVFRTVKEWIVEKCPNCGDDEYDSTEKPEI